LSEQRIDINTQETGVGPHGTTGKGGTRKSIPVASLDRFKMTNTQSQALRNVSERQAGSLSRLTKLF
jgi:hypothetical protein